MTTLRITFMGGPLDGKYKDLQFHKITWDSEGYAEGVEYLVPVRRKSMSEYVQEGGELTEPMYQNHVYTLQKVGEHFFFMYRGERR